MGVKITFKKVSQFHGVDSVTAAGATAIWTPTAAGNFIRLLRYRFIVSGDAYAALAALVLSIADGVTVLPWASYRVAVPVAAPAAITRGALFDTGDVDLGLGYVTAAKGNALSANLSEVLAAGAVTCILYGLEGPSV
ncbi:MAG: hypothetical protein ACYDBH_12260 [Acidobacteriaceae bacterium]